MSCLYLSDKLWFPPVEEADEIGLLAIGGDLSPERLLLAYSLGIFPWYNPGEPILWWSPDPRCVLFPEQVHISKSLRKVLRRAEFLVTFDRDFSGVIDACRAMRRETGTWITPEMQRAYILLHRLGFAHSVECWQGEELVGGLYGLGLGGCFFGESMFSRVANGSKVAMVTLCRHLSQLGVRLIDCQQTSHHLLSLGACEISRAEFCQVVNEELLDERQHLRSIFPKAV
ncbi:leucyl/phenylalanyl-tRNA--protein transferase [Geopsychrobacter electrodiphilus]|uniref:leucyl/phenylalanyl-tRNA--protein transferase n=1 Tax=Geopsychrobacter electrodiphilus TaxID=225196 RepID=UPI00035DE69F|nr:leucyl/phenylalanyl-tRNA--protein transferase [Geopsychrobacter electrodiphilus]